MSRHLDEHLDLCAGYALDCLDPADRARLSEHLAEGCDVCEAALKEFGAAAVLLASTAPAASPSPRLRERLLAAAGASGRRPAEPGEARGPIVELRPRRFAVWTALGWAAVAASLIAVAVSTQRAGRLARTLDEQRGQMAQLRQQLADQERWASVLSAPGARVALITPTAEGTPELRGRATYDPTTRRAVLVFENVKAPEGRDYELWAIRGAAPKAIGLLKPDASGRAMLYLEDAGDPTSLNAFAVSLEPAGGAPTPDAPTGPVVMLGKLGG